MIRNQNWYNLNEKRPYPVDDSATLEDNNGTLLPSNIITDMNIKYPAVLGRYPFISSVAVTDKLVSVTLQVADSLTDETTFTPLAVVTQRLPIAEATKIAIEPQYPGVGGEIVFGSGIQSPYQGRFSEAEKTLLGRRSVRPYAKFPVEGFSKFGHFQNLTGIVELKADEPVQISAESRDIDGIERDVIVIKLTETGGETNVFDLFSQPCNGRAESENCGDPVPVEFIGGVGPDCNGNICIEFRSCGQLSEILGDCGIVVDCDLGLEEACVIKNRLPDPDGRLPGQGQDLCDIVSSEDIPPDFSSASSASSDDGGPTPGPGISACSYPLLEDFEDGIADGFSVVNGSWAVVEEIAPGPTSTFYYASEGTLSLAQRNISLYECVGSNVGRKITSDLKLQLPTDTGGKINGGILLNYNPHPTIPGRYVYYLVTIDFDNQQFEIRRFNGTTYVTLASVIVPGINLNELFKLEVIVVDAGSGNTSITATMDGIDINNAAVFASIGPLIDSNYIQAEGFFGLQTNRANTRFDNFDLEEYP